MYPDRAMFQRMVQDEPNLSGAGRETLLVLYDGPLRLRQILTFLNEQGRAGNNPKKERNISESALRKRLDQLIANGIIARAGSERTNPYFYIHRQWIFNKYILVKCRDGPSSGLVDLTVLLHELSHMVSESGTLPNPRYIAATGERTERSHQIETAFLAFKNLLGNPGAIGDYLEGIYEDIYHGNIPSSDIDGLVARDFLRLVATAPPEEREVRFFFWYADFFHLLDRYEEGYSAFRQGIDTAERGGFDTDAILAEFHVSEGHFLMHRNDLAGAKEAFLRMARKKEAGPFIRAKSFYGAGEVDLACGEISTRGAPALFVQALELCTTADPACGDADVQDLRANLLRRTGTIHRVSGRLGEADACYQDVEKMCTGRIARGLVWLMLEKAELQRARAFSSPLPDAGKYLAEAAAAYEEAKTVSQRIRNISWFAHALLGECELARVAYQRLGRPLPPDIDTKYANAFEIYCQISSHWGIAQTFISEALLYHAAPEALPDKYAVTADKLDQAERFSRDLGLKSELALIRQIKTSRDPAPGLHPLTFL